MLSEDKENFQQEQNQLLKAILHSRFFSPWSYDFGDQYSLRQQAGLEIYVTNACNQNCSYCYLTKQPELYPKGISEEQILDNLRLLYQWVIDNGYHIPKAEFFSGEIWHTPFGWKVLDITLDYLHKGMAIDWFMTATNFSFIFTDEALFKMNYYLRSFKECGHELILSCSCDGGVVENYSRPVNNGQIRDEKYWQRMFEFCKVQKCYFHPMVSSKNAKDWPENYKWWDENCRKWGINPHKAVTMLEVRNNDWTDETIKDYCNFLEFLIQDRLKKANGDIPTYCRRVLSIRNEGVQEDEYNESGYFPLSIPTSDTFAGCTIDLDLTIRLGDLAICPCHRTAYNQYLYGKFIVKDNHIVDIEAINPNMAIRVLMGNILQCNNGCDTCSINKCCLHGCYGSQIENTGDPFFCCENVCKFFKAKYGYLFKRYEELGIFDYLRTVTPYEQDYDRVLMILNIFDNWKKLEADNV